VIWVALLLVTSVVSCVVLGVTKLSDDLKDLQVEVDRLSRGYRAYDDKFTATREDLYKVQKDMARLQARSALTWTLDDDTKRVGGTR
jgi:hypothetical protein